MSIDFKSAVISNEQYLCSVPSCNRKREGMSKYCQPHRKRLERYGSATGTPIMGLGGKRFYKRELEYTHQLIIKNSDTKPVLAAVKILHQWINGCAGGLDLPGSRLVSLINPEGKELAILSELSSAYIFGIEVKRQSQRELIFTLANSLFKFVPVPYEQYISRTGKSHRKPLLKMGSMDREAIGTYIIQELGIFLENIRQHFTATEQQHQTLKHDLMGSLS